jgi:cell division protein ZapB
MDPELTALEDKLTQFVEFCQQLRADNQELRQQLASAVGESKRLEQKITAATDRLEGLLTHLPDEA